MHADTIEMPPAEKNFVEEDLIPAPKQSTVIGETKQFLINNTLQLNNFPVKYNLILITSLSSATYNLGTDYTVNWSTGVVTRVPTGNIGVEQTVSINYTHTNTKPATVISSYGRKRRKVNIEGWANYTDWASVELDYGQDVKKNVTLPTGEIVEMYINRISKTTRKRGLDRIFYSLEFMEA